MEEMEQRGGRGRPVVHAVEAMTRRSLLRHAGVGLGALSLPALLAACGDGGSASTGAATTAAGAGTMPAGAPSGTVDYLGFEGLDFSSSDAMRRWLGEQDMTVSSRYWTTLKDGIGVFLGGRGDGIDAVHAATCTLPLLIEAGDIVQPLDRAQLPNLSGLSPDFQGTDQPWYVDGQLMMVPLATSPFSLMWDSERVDPAPRSWSDLLEPRFKGRLAVYNDPLVHIWTITEILRLGPQGRLPKAAGKQAGEYLKRQVDNARVLPASIGDVVTAFANEDVDACFCGAPIFAVLAQQSGAAAVRFDMEPSDGNTLSTEGIALAARTDNAEAVHAWLDEGLAPVPNADYASLLGGAPIVADAYEEMDPAIAELFPPGTIERLARRFPFSLPLPLESDEYLTDAEWTEIWSGIAGS